MIDSAGWRRRMRGARLRLAAVVLPLAGAVAAAAGTASGTGGSEAAGVVAPAALQQGRAFDHARHAGVSCRACHGAGERHRTNLVRSALDCAGCHHDPVRAPACATCHRAAELPAPRRIAVAVTLPGRATAAWRELPFSHERHEGVTCQACHRTAVTLAPDQGCSGCHAAHHGETASCSTCHQPPDRRVHEGRAHLSCAAAGCHAAGAVPAAAAAGAACLACHTVAATHAPAGDCATCHLIPVDGAAGAPAPIDGRPGR
jgi:hypothetical protein